MDRKSIIAIALAVLVIGWAQYQTQKEQARYRKAQEEALANATPTPEAATPAVPAPTAAPAPVAPVAPPVAKPSIPEQTKTVLTPAVDYTFTNLGGGIASLKLLNHLGAKSDQKMVLNTNASHPIGAMLLKPDDAENDSYEVRTTDDQVIFEKTLPSGVQVTKTYTISQKPADEYRVDLALTFTNRSAIPMVQPGYFLFTGAATPIHSTDIPYYIGFDWYNGKTNTFITPGWFEASKVPLVGVETSPAKATYVETTGNVIWAGVRDQYFTSLITSLDAKGKGVWARPISLQVESKETKGIEGALEMPGFNLNAGETVTSKFSIYAGPAEYKRLAALSHNETQMMNLDRWWITRTVGMWLLRSMIFLEGFLHSYAWAIIVLTFIVRGALWPIQGKANASMKRMQLLIPKQNEIKEKYKDDPARMNQEVMNLYKQYGVNPFGGCLPMLIQIPIFIGFYSMLGTAVELRNSSFLWVPDLSMPDTVFHLAGIPVNILPLAMAGTMVWQMQLTPKTGDPAQQKMLMFMPLVFVFVTYNFASALALYYTVQNILSIIQLYATRNAPMPALEKASSGPSKKNRR